ncbi:MAG: hypothetical protein DVB26_08650 [Verrucomicrobia bacterium]|nr:MAG: hypothetical protein DVB26_08650 [Verrucomicrobiota bacterium]
MKKLGILLMAGLLVTSCVPITPQMRMQKHPDLYAALSPSERQWVERGELAKGMSRDAVFLAWGPPAMSYEGNQQGKASMRWDYTGEHAVYAERYHGGDGYRGHYAHPYGDSAYGFAPELTFVPYRRASVWFVNNRVDGWERLR